MSWRVIVRPAVRRDVAEAATWYEDQQSGLGADFVEEVIRMWDALGENPRLNSRRESRRDIRWRYAERFPYRIIYEIGAGERTVVIYAVLHAARQDGQWKRRV